MLDGYDYENRTSVPVSAFDMGHEVTDLLTLLPGDVMYLGPPDGQDAGGHVRIVMRIDDLDTTNKVIVFTTVESTEDMRGGADPNSNRGFNNGPREHHWRWTATNEAAHAPATFEQRYEASAAWVPAPLLPFYRHVGTPPPQ